MFLIAIIWNDENCASHTKADQNVLKGFIFNKFIVTFAFKLFTIMIVIECQNYCFIISKLYMWILDDYD